jgi:hypothetical protein
MASEPVTVIKDLLAADWDEDNTDGIIPTIDLLCNHVNLDLSDVQNADYILVYSLRPSSTGPNGSGTGTKEVEERVKIDLRTMKSLSHAWKVLKEIERVLENNQVGPATDYDLLDPYGDAECLNDEYMGLWHYTKVCTLKNTNHAAGGS